MNVLKQVWSKFGIVQMFVSYIECNVNAVSFIKIIMYTTNGWIFGFCKNTEQSGDYLEWVVMGYTEVRILDNVQYLVVSQKT